MSSQTDPLENALTTASLLLEKGWVDQYHKMMTLARSLAHNRRGLGRSDALRQVIEAQEQQIGLLLARESRHQ